MYSIKFKAIVLAAVCLILPCAFLSAQSADYVLGHESEVTASESKKADERSSAVFTSETESKDNKTSTTALSDSKDAESKVKLSSAATTKTDGQKKKSGASTFLLFLRMILVLAIVLAIIWIIFKLLQKTSGGSSGADDKFLRKVASLSISPGKSVQIVTLVDRAFLIGVADNSVNLLCEIDDQELISAMNLYADKNNPGNKPKNFGEVLDIFMPKKKNSGKAKNVFEDGAAQQVLDSLKRQSDRMNRGE